MPRFPVTKKNAITPYVVNHLCNLYGPRRCRLQCLTSWPLWLWIMAVTWLHLPLTLSRLGLRNLGMWAWAVHLRYIRFWQKLVRVLGYEETLPWARQCNKLYSTICIVLLSEFVSQNTWLQHFNQWCRENWMFRCKRMKLGLLTEKNAQCENGNLNFV